MSESERGKYALTDDDGDEIYSLIINIPKNKFSFVLFKGIVDWNSRDIYWATVPIEMVDETEILLTKTVSQNISYSNWEGGEVQLEFDSKTERLKIRSLEIDNAEILYLVGAPTGYIEPTIENKELFKEYAFADIDGDGIYKGSISIPSDAFEFCFAKGLNGDSTTYVVPNNSEVVKFDFYGIYEGATNYTQSLQYWTYNDWQSTEDIEVVYDSNLNTISFTCGALEQTKYLYLIGTPSGWIGPDSGNEPYLRKWRLKNSEDNENVYKGEFEIDNSQQLVFRFYDALTGWDGGRSYGCEVDDNVFHYNIDENGIYQGVIKKGKGSWAFAQWPTNKLYIEVDFSNMTVLFSCNEASVNVVIEDDINICVVGENMLSIETTNENVCYEIYNMQGLLVGKGADKIINLEGFCQGVYLIKIEDAENYKVKRFIVR
ncbi:MAG: T9SS type A sorting domain-containing protein [Muribaculaceae bacterium]|nr:T9SS type A sorting domain-containing protein [Muribaculaceae bacterium]